MKINLRDKIEVLPGGRGDHDLHKMNGNNLRLRGRWKVEVERKGKIIQTMEFDNTIVDDGANTLLNVNFDAATQVPQWYVGLVDEAGFSAFSNADLMNAHIGWAESVAYSESNRVPWSPASSTARSLANASAFVFSINGACVIHGVFVTSDNTKGGTVGKLLSTAAFSGPETRSPGDVLRMIYTISC